MVTSALHKKISGEALTTACSGTLELSLQVIEIDLEDIQSLPGER